MGSAFGGASSAKIDTNSLAGRALEDAMKTNTIKSLTLVGVAVVIGLGILSAGYDDPTVDFSTASPTATPDAVETPTPVPEPTVDTGLTPPAAVSVLVANATGVEGLASTISDELATGSGYTMLPPTNAAEGTNGATSIIYYAAGSDAAARGVASALGLDPNGVLPIPDPPPVADATGADVLVVAGDDLVPTG